VTEINGKPTQDAWLVNVSCMGARLDTTSALSPNLQVQFYGVNWDLDRLAKKESSK
jgi:hypothetical protein